jgi:hypothetical protein
LFGVKSRAKVGDRGGAPVSVIDQLLSRIKGLFEPKPAPSVTEQAESDFREPITVAFERPPVEEPPAPVAEAPTLPSAAPALVEEAPTVVSESATAVAEAPPDVEEATPDIVESTLPVAPAGGVTLRLESERGPRSTFEVTKSGATIGRGPESTIQLADLSVSRKHAKITYKQGAYWVSDLGSMGGTWIDGTKLAAPRRVETGQTIDIGLCRLTVVAAAEGEQSGAAKGPSNAA